MPDEKKSTSNDNSSREQQSMQHSRKGAPGGTAKADDPEVTSPWNKNYVNKRKGGPQGPKQVYRGIDMPY